MIPYGRQTIEEDDIEEVVKVLKSDFLTTGPKVAEFERAVAEYVGAKYAVAISNDTAALHAACHAAGIGPGDEGITTPVTFAASARSRIRPKRLFRCIWQDSPAIWMPFMRSQRSII